MKRRLLAVFFTALSIYFLSYIWLRQSRVEKWEQDGNVYVIFPPDNIYLYYLYRPLTLIDANLTGMKFHIGQHR